MLLIENKNIILTSNDSKNKKSIIKTCDIWLKTQVFKAHKSREIMIKSMCIFMMAYLFTHSKSTLYILRDNNCVIYW